MPTPQRSARSLRSGPSAALMLLATLGLAGVLAYQALRAAGSHRATAEAMLRDYAAVAAWQFVRESRIWLDFGMFQAGNQISREIPPAGGPLPGPEMLRRVLAEKECDCVSAGFARSVFRVTFDSTPAWAVDGDPLAEATRAGIIARVRADTLPMRGPSRWLMLPPGQPALEHPDDMILVWLIPGSPGASRGRARAAFGMVVEAFQLTRPLTGAAGDAVLLPPSLTGSIRADSLIAVRVLGPNGAVMFRSDLADRPVGSEYAATDSLGWRYGDLAVRAAVRAEAAPSLIIGGLPASRLPQIAVLLGLTVLVGLGALILLRREQQLVQLRDDFVSSVSHELRTPLTQVRVMSELLAGDGFRTEAEAQRAKDVIRREALRLTNLVDNVLQFGRLRRGAAPLPAAPIPLGEVIAEAREAFAPLLAERQVQVLVRGGSGVVVPADRDALVQILRNLLENALKYGPAGQTIGVAVESADGIVRLAVEDQGPGVPAADRQRIWQPYQRLSRDRNAAAAGGSGLGLSVVAELTALMRGRAWVEEAAGGGARFVVEFPAAAGAAR